MTVVGIKRPGADFTHATAETVVHPGDVILVTGKTRAVETFAELGQWTMQQGERLRRVLQRPVEQSAAVSCPGFRAGCTS